MAKPTRQRGKRIRFDPQAASDGSKARGHGQYRVRTDEEIQAMHQAVRASGIPAYVPQQNRINPSRPS